MRPWSHMARLVGRRSAGTRLGWLTLVGVALAVATFVVTLAIIDGFTASYRDGLVRFNAPVVLMREDEAVESARVQAAVREIPEITAASPFLYREGLLVGNGHIRGVILRGVDPAAFAHVTKVQLQLQPGHTDLVSAFHTAPGTPLPILLGAALAEELGTSEVQLYAPTAELIPVHVIGQFRSGIWEFDHSFAFVPLAPLQSLYDRRDRVTGFEFQVADLDRAPAVVARLQAALGPPYEIHDWRELHRETFEALGLEKILFGFIMGILVLIAVTNIAAVTLLNIFTRHRAVATLLAIGMAVRDAQRLFFWQGLRLGAIGAALGLGVGAAVAWGLGHYQWIDIDPEIYFLTTIPVVLSWPLALGSAAFGCLAAALPAWFASRTVTRLPILHSLGRGYV